jgi:hypothetical protein
MKVKPVRDASRDDHGLQLMLAYLKRNPVARLSGTEIGQTYRRPAGDKNLEVLVLMVNMHAPESPRLRMEQVPLDGIEAGLPLVAKRLGERTSLVAVGRQRP